MTVDGIIYINMRERGEFAKLTGYADDSIKFAFAELKRKGFLIEHSRGVAWVNPLYAWKGSEEDRMKAIQTALAGKYEGLKVRMER